MKSRFAYALGRVKRPEALVTITLLFLLLTVAVASVTSVLIGPDWNSLWKGLLLGLLAGWTLAVFKQPAIRSLAILLAIGIIYSLLSAGGLSQKLLPVLGEPLRMFIVFVTSPRGTEIDFAPLAGLIQDLFTSSTVVLERVRVWITALSAGEPVFDPVAAGIMWGMLVWIAAAWAGWIVEARKNALLAVIPAILLSVSTLSYGRFVTSTLYWMLGLALILLATVQHDRREGEWDAKGVAYPARKGRQIGSYVILITAGLVIFSAFISSISLQRIEKWLVVRSRPAVPEEGGLAKSLGILPGSANTPDAFESVRRPGLPRDLLIGSGPELSRQLVMTVEVNDLPTILRAGKPRQLYWRSFSYDMYTGSGWRSSNTSQSLLQPFQPLEADVEQNHLIVQQTVRPVGGSDGAVYAAGEPILVNLQSEAAWRSNGDLFGIQIEDGVPYEARSLIPAVSEQSLRAAGQRYPEWVRQRYMALPPELPTRVKELAIQLTSTEPTPYDRARSIERYLRTIPYTVDVARPPSNQDIVDFFLYDLKKGYCDYYASAMVVLARAAGVPTRLAIGYAGGEYNLNSRRFMVTEADAHSWVEVYFPNIGWIPFEPTASRPSLEELPESINETSPEKNPSPEGAPISAVKSTSWVLLLLSGGTALAIVLLLTWTVYDTQRLRSLLETEAAGEVYRRMRRYGAHLVVASDAGDTPYEYADALSRGLQELAGEGFNSRFWLSTAQRVQTITDRIVRVSYRPVQSEKEPEVRLQQLWSQLRWRLRLMLFVKGWKTVRDHIFGVMKQSQVPSGRDAGSEADQE